MKKSLLFISVFCVGLLSCSKENNRAPNILFISVDDLRPIWTIRIENDVFTPNLDSLMKYSTLFKNAFAQEPTCAPSRASILTGLRPNSTKVFDLFTPLRTVKPDVVTLPQLLKNNGYTSISLGKMFHHENEDDSLSWSEPSWRAELGNLRGYLDPKNISRIMPHGNSTFYEIVDTVDTAYEDGKTAVKAIEYLKQFKDNQEPFFLAVGLFKPHLPFNIPKRYWDLYDSTKIKKSEFSKMRLDRTPYLSYNWGGEINSYIGAVKEPDLVENGSELDTVMVFDSATESKLIHGYLASVSYADAQLGKIIRALNDLNLDDNTHIVLWSDHGWLLGEVGDWAKQGLYDYQTASTLLVHQANQNYGNEYEGLVELVDVYPTVCDLVEITPNSNLEGESLFPLLSDSAIPGKKFVYSQYIRVWEDENFKGYTTRSNRYRYIEWYSEKGELIDSEFYDLEADRVEVHNIIDNEETFEIQNNHMVSLRDHFNL